MISEVFRVLRSGGQFVMTNLCPREVVNWIYYRYFPATWEKDLQDFMPKEEMSELMTQVGFDRVEIHLNHQESEEDLRHFAESVRRRDTCSQLITISDADYRAGLEQIDSELRCAEGKPISVQTEFCLMKIAGEKGTDGL